MMPSPPPVSRLTTRQVLIGTLAVADAAACFVAGTPWLRAYQVQRAPLLLVLAAVVPVVLSGVLSRWLRFSPAVSYAASAAGLVVLVGASNSFDFHAAWYGVTHVPAQLLTETLPLAGAPYLLVPLLVVTWTCAAVSAELLLRPPIPSASGLAVPLVSFCLAFAATTSAPEGETAPLAAGLLGVLLLGGLVRQALLEPALVDAAATMSAPSGGVSADGSDARHSKRRRAVANGDGLGSGRRRTNAWARRGTAAVLAGAALAGLAAGIPSVPALASHPAALSRHTRLLSGTVTDPVDVMAALRASAAAGPDKEIFAVDVGQTWSGYISTATLDNYDGWGWYFADTFRPTGGRVPGAPPLAQPGPSQPGTSVVWQHYVVERSIGLPFLPAIDRAVQVQGVPVDADPATGMLAAQLSTPFSYSVVSRAPYVTAANLAAPSALASGESVPGGTEASYTSLPAGSEKDVAQAVRFAVNLTRLPASPSFGFLQELAQALRLHERRVQEAPHRKAGAQGEGASAHHGSAGARGAPGGASPAGAFGGTSLAGVINAVTVDRAATPEQFATFFAAVARYVGVPVRLVTGFRVPAAGLHQSPLRPGRYKLDSSDAWTWDEVPIVGYGWVVVDPTPVLTTASVSAPPEEVKATPPSKPHPATALPGNRASHALAKPVRPRLHPPVQVDWAVALGAGLPSAAVLALLLVLLGVPAMRRRLRRLARHQRSDPALLAAGAWLELIDGLSRLGAEVPVSATSSEVVGEVAGRFGDEAVVPAQVVANAADQALYSSRWPIGEAEALTAWECQRELYRHMRRCSGRKQRARSLLVVGAAPAKPAAVLPERED